MISFASSPSNVLSIPSRQAHIDGHGRHRSGPRSIPSPSTTYSKKLCERNK